MEKEILKLILETEDNYKTAELIGNTLKAAEEEVLYKVLKAINKKIIEKIDYQEHIAQESIMTGLK